MNYFRGLTDDECKIYDSWINQESINTGENLFNISNDSKPKTNGDRIRQMTDEELAEIVRFEDCSGQHYECPGWKQDHNCDCKECFFNMVKTRCK